MSTPKDILQKPPTQKFQKETWNNVLQIIPALTAPKKTNKHKSPNLTK